MAGISVVFKAVDQISSRFDNMTNAGNGALDMFDNLGQAADSACSAMSDGLSEMVDNLDATASATENVTSQVDDYSDKLDEAGRVSEEMGEKAEEAAKKTKKLGDETEDTGKKSEKMGKTSKEAFGELDELLTQAGIAVVVKEIGEAFMEASDAAAGFETSLAMVTTIADSTVLSSDQLSKEITQLSKDISKDVNEISETAYNAISAGMDTANAVDSVGEANMLAVAGFTNIGSSLSVLSTTLNAYKMEASQMEQISDSLVTTQNLGVLTIDQLASSMGKAISTASAYSVDLYNLESGYISLTKAGISVEESTTYISSMFNELGSAGTEVSAILEERTGKSFGELMKEGYTLADVLKILHESVDGNSEALMNLWGSAEAGKAANAIVGQGLENFNSNLEAVKNSAGTTEAAYEKMTNTTEYSSQRLENAAQNLAIAFGDDLNPIISAFNNTMAGAIDGISGFIEEHPEVSAGITYITTAVAGLTAAVVLHTAATKGAILVTKLFSSIAALNPVTLGVVGVAALAAGIAVYAANVDDATEKAEDFTLGCRDQFEELESLNDQYEKTCEKYGENSEQADKLRLQIEALDEEFQKSKKTVAEFYEELDATCEAHDSVVDAFNTTNDEIDKQDIQTQSLIERMQSLSTATVQNVGTQEQLKSIVESLNEKYPELGLSIENVNGNLDEMIEKINAASGADTMSQKAKNASDTYAQLVAEQAELEKMQAEAQIYYQEASDAFFNESGVKKFTGWLFDSGSSEAMDQAAAELDKVNAKLEENKEIQQECIATMEEYGEVITGTSDTLISEQDAVAIAVEGVSEKVTDLVMRYDEAYASASSSINGQIGLFQTMKTECEQSVTDMQKALESQYEYLNNYTENLNKAESYGLNEVLIFSLSDGTAESAGQLDAIIEKIEALGGTTEGMSEKSQEFINNFNESFAKVETAKETWSNTVADMETDFSERMTNIQTELADAITNMNMADEAKASAVSTIDAYINAIKSKTPELKSAINAVNVSSSQFGASIFIDKEVNGYAVGTSSAEPGLALVGENGPELVDFSGGEKVYTADETAALVGRGPKDNEFYIPPSTTEESSKVSEDKTITLRLEGAGEMKVGTNGMSKEDVLKVLMENVKGVLLDIIQQEIMEEGDLSYEF